MCGVSVILDKKKQLNEGPIQQMMASLSYRGPDANGWAMRESPNQQIFLGHTRLSIIDADNTASNQPMRSRNQQYWLVYNGEIYNYAELRNELEMKGIQFYTWSDTEVLLEGLANEGVDFLDKVNGMYAFVCWDSEKQEIMAFRDPSGMKPLYIFDNEFYTIFSSSIPAIFASQLVEPELNASVVEHYLRYK
ncbi:MAG: asparagine synthase (glutamine-hydrolyzing), partial [Cytophagales bacterium]|nr:asparagine synthase (glutamine-hydrolyzing) [Cytophagales bacterium]